MNDVTILNQFGYPLADIETIRDSISREINGEYVFTFTAPRQELKTQYIDTDNSVVVDGQTFDIVYYDESHGLDGKVEYNVEAWHVFYRLKNESLDYFTKDGTPTQILTHILSGTDFSVGTVEFFTVMTFAVHEPKTLCDLLFTFANDLGAEVEFSGNGFTINLLNTIGQDNDFEIRTGRNLKSIKKSVDKRRGETITAYSVDLVELKNSTEYIANGYESLEVIGIGDTVRVIDEVTGLTETQRIKKVQYSPRFRKNTALEIANKIELFTDSITRIQRETVAKNTVYNGIRISPDLGFEAIRSDNKAKTILNATEGISIYADAGSGLERNFYVDTSGRIKARSIDILEDSTFNGSINVSTDATIGNNIYLNTGLVVDKGLYFRSNIGLFWKEWNIEGDYGLELINSSGRVTIRSDESIFASNDSETVGINIDCSSNDLTLFAYGEIIINGNTAFNNPANFDDIVNFNNNVSFNNYVEFEGSVDFTSASSLAGLKTVTVSGHSHSGSTDTDGSHNHGITPGLRLAVVDESNNIIGSVEFVQSGSHSHSVSTGSAGSHYHTVTL